MWPKKESAKPVETGLETATGAEPVLTCDSHKQVGYFHIKRGEWAGKGVARLKCCENPLCGCANVDFYCPMDDGSEREMVLYFSLDPMKCEIAPNHDKDRHEDSAALAEAMTAEFGDEDWQRLRQYLLTRKQYAIRNMNVRRLQPPAPEAMTNDDSMVRFADMFPFALGFEFELDGEQWAADDQYCVMPYCDCRVVALSFVSLAASTGSSDVIENGRNPLARYDYKAGTIETVQAPASGQPSLETLVAAVRKAHPSLDKDVERRHRQMRLLYARALRMAGKNRPAPVTQPVRVEPKIGRNEPCPCGSGKKYKKCCGIAN
jgi:hypothetical protein